jgi:hypothetical protein
MSTNKQTITVTKEEIINILNEQEKGTFVNILSETRVRMNKKNNPYYERVMKRNKCNYLLGVSYEDRVIGNGTKEGIDMSTFEVQENRVGEHVSKCVLFNEKTQKHYVMVERFIEVKPQTEYLMEGNSIDKTLFQDYLVKVSESKTQPQERKVLVQSFTIDNIRELSLNGTKYVIE